MSIRVFIISALFFCALGSRAQVSNEISADQERKFTPYMYWRHGGPEGVAQFKKTKPGEYARELWYYTSSFTVKRNHLATGVELDESIIDISRFEQHRLQDQPFILELPGFKDALVLVPVKDLLWRPKQ